MGDRHTATIGNAKGAKQRYKQGSSPTVVATCLRGLGKTTAPGQGPPRVNELTDGGAQASPCATSLGLFLSEWFPPHGVLSHHGSQNQSIEMSEENTKPYIKFFSLLNIKIFNMVLYIHI